MPTHLPSDEILADYAHGATTPGVAFLLAAHLTQSAESRSKVRAFERVGGAMLTSGDDAPMGAHALDAVLARLDAAPGQEFAPAPVIDGGPLPRSVTDRIGVAFDEIPWKRRLPGVAVYDFDGFGDETVQLLRARPGVSVPQHTHEGSEMTLVMQGVLMDDGVEYHKGDVAVNDEHDDHRPRILGDETCYCLIVQEGSLKFTGTFSRVLNLLGE
ncbi:MAG: ChrR family anti-sigma-E factor [Pseudomonadota bacterium]